MLAKCLRGLNFKNAVSFWSRVFYLVLIVIPTERFCATRDLVWLNPRRVLAVFGMTDGKV